MKNTPFFSVVIPTLNEEKYLPKLLKDLSKQTFDNFEVIHVDGSSDDKTVKKAQLFEKKLNIKTYVVKKRNVSFQRNYGGGKTNGKWIIFMDADDELPDYFLDGIKYQVSKNKKMEVFTTYLNLKGKPIYQTIQKAVNMALDLQNQLKAKAAPGAMIGVKKEIFQHIKFDESQKLFEDFLFVTNCAKAGHKFLVLKEPTYSFSIRRFKKEGLLKMTHVSASSLLRYFQNKNFQEKDCGYVMKGGGYYDQKKEILPELQKLVNTILEKVF